jgi:hypothetical protein
MPVCGLTIDAWLALRSGCFTRLDTSGMHWTDTRAGLDAVISVKCFKDPIKRLFTKENVWYFSNPGGGQQH